MNPIKHVAIIMDGNGRWGIKNKGSRNAGHKAGLHTVEKVIDETIRQKINYLTLYTFSTENWRRPHKETFFLFNLLESYLSKKMKDLDKNKIKVKILGNKKKLSKKLQLLINKTEKKKIINKKLQINLALNYGSKEELLYAINKIKKNRNRITESQIVKNLYTKDIPDPDLLIRTGNTKRLSNFLLWQLAYTEFFFHKKMWPDFTKDDYKKILNEFRFLKRNYGSI